MNFGHLKHTCINILKFMSSNSYFCSLSLFLLPTFSLSIFSSCVLVISYCVLNISFEKLFAERIWGLEQYRTYACFCYAWRIADAESYLIQFNIKRASSWIAASLRASTAVQFAPRVQPFHDPNLKGSGFIRPPLYTSSLLCLVSSALCSWYTMPDKCAAQPFSWLL